MKNKVSITNTGIESSGLVKDYMDAVAELIWNGFDARAKNISIDFNTNVIDSISEIAICDDGEGIDFKTLDETFGNFNDSIKKNSYQKTSSSIRGHKGKGRFSFTAFSGLCIWQTVFKENETCLEYDITISKNSKADYDIENKKISKKNSTGTTVRLKDLFNVTAYSFMNEEFENFLSKEYGWFLLLNKEQKFSLSINGKPINYENIIAESETSTLKIKDHENNEVDFKITFVRWHEKIGDKFYFYFLNSDKKEAHKELTSFNNNAMGFYHSVYVESPYFNTFNSSDKEQSLSLFEQNTNTKVFKALNDHLHTLVKNKQKFFLNGPASDDLISNYEKTGVIPKFRNNKYEQARRSDLINVVKGIYCIEPKIFQGLNKEQQKISVGLINLLLDTDERENIIELIGKIISLSSDEREELLNLLKKTTISKISKTINLIEGRYNVVELLKILVFDLEKFTNERDHIQKVIEENYWLFGEQYHLVSANEGFNVLLNKYLELIEGLKMEDQKKLGKKRVNSEDSDRRPDIFICRKHTVPDSLDHDYQMEENLIVELKRPSVEIGKEQLRQIEDYLDIIRNESQFNSQKRFWKFFIIGISVDNYVKDQYDSEKTKGKRFLVKGFQNFEIYAFTWDDVFKMFELRHKFIVDNLDFDRSILRKELIEKGINLFDEENISNEITQKVIDLNKGNRLN